MGTSFRGSDSSATVKDAWNLRSKYGVLMWNTSRWRWGACWVPSPDAWSAAAPAPPARRFGRSSRVSFSLRSTRIVRPASRNTVLGATAHRSGDPARMVSSSAFRELFRSVTVVRYACCTRTS